MGKIGRVACVALPMILTFISLICLLLVFCAGQSKGLQYLYFLRTDLSNFKSTPDVKMTSGNEQIDMEILSLLQSGVSQDKIKNFYQVYFWNYCSGDNAADLDFCSPREAKFYFDPITVWGLQGGSLEQKFPDKIKSVMDSYAKVAGWMYAAYGIAFFATLANLVLGFFAICSRWGSCITTIAASVSASFTLLATLTSTIIFAALAGGLNTIFKPYGLKATLGSSMLAVEWIGVLASCAAGVLWLFSTCCVSGKSDKKKVTVEKTPYTYERVTDPYGHQNDGAHVPLQNMNTGYGRDNAYEPYRNQPAGSHV